MAMKRCKPLVVDDDLPVVEVGTRILGDAADE
jgi:hypothetical protein